MSTAEGGETTQVGIAGPSTKPGSEDKNVRSGSDFSPAGQKSLSKQPVRPRSASQSEPDPNGPRDRRSADNNLAQSTTANTLDEKDKSWEPLVIHWILLFVVWYLLRAVLLAFLWSLTSFILGVSKNCFGSNCCPNFGYFVDKKKRDFARDLRDWMWRIGLWAEHTGTNSREPTI